MIANLPPHLFASVNTHSDKVWLSIHSGGSAVLSLTPEQAQELGRMLMRAGLNTKQTPTT